jgi:hypothetical protein
MVALPAVQGRPLYGVDVNNKLVRFGSLDPQTITNSKVISVIQNDEMILALDFRPADRRLYVIDTLSTAALQVGISAFIPSMKGNDRQNSQKQIVFHGVILLFS